MTEQDALQDRITAFWSMVAPGYEAHPGNVPESDSEEYTAWVDAIRRLLPPAPADILDIATGTGFVAFVADALGHRVTGVDLAEPMLEVARAAASRIGSRVRFLLADAVDPPLPPGSFDAVVCRHFLWTLRAPAAAIANWRRLLRPGGCVVVIDGFWFRPEASADGAGEPEPGPFEQFYTRETREALPGWQYSSVEPLVQLFRAGGFNEVSVEYLTDAWQLAKSAPGEEAWYAVRAQGARPPTA